MAVKDYGVGVSGYLDPEGRNWETSVYQASKPVLDTELNLTQDTNQQRARLRTGIPSGWLSASVLDSSGSGDVFTPTAVVNEYEFSPLKALVNDWPLLVRYINDSTTSNKVDLGASPAGVGAKRTDMVFLEVWRRLIPGAPTGDGKSAAGRIWRNGNVQIDPAEDVTLNFVDDIVDGAVGSETTKRVQLQYRVRVFQGVDIDTYPQGLGDPTLFSHTVPAAAAAPDGVVTAFAYTNQSPNGDSGLWVAGDGNPANGLGTVDGFMYAIPLSAIFRRNTTAFAQTNNMNGGVADPGPSDRPDGFLYDIIEARDVLDLRQHISQSGWDLQELMTKSVNYLFDNTLAVEQETSIQAGSQAGHTNLWADEIGPTDTTGPQLIRNFDTTSRRFSDRAILETVWLKYTPADQDVPGATWDSSKSITIDPTSLPIHPHASLNFASVAPSDVSIVDILSTVWVGDSLATRFNGHFDDTDGTGNVWDPDFIAFANIPNIGTVPMASMTCRFGPHIPGASTMDLYVQLLISYPTGGGLTKTPVDDYAADSFVNETPANLPAAAPYLFSAMETQAFDFPHREVELTYRTLSQSFDQYFTDFGGTPVDKGLPADTSVLFLPDRTDTVSLITNTTTAATYTGVINISDDGHYLFIRNLAADWSNATPAVDTTDLIQTDFEAIRPIPENSIQFTLWYEAKAPQMIREGLLGTSIQVIPRYVSPHMFALTTGSGSQGESYPFSQQYVQSPGVYPGSGGTFDGDHELDASTGVNVADFSADTGFIQLPTLIPAVPEPQNLVFNRAPGDIDAEGRSFFKEVPAGYIPSAFSQPLSNPKKHKNCLPMICELAADGPIGPQGTLLLVMMSRWASFDSDNKVAFDPDLASNVTSASVYRLKGNPLGNRRG